MNENFNPQIAIGALFQHYSGKKYRILGLGRHSETLEWCVVYQGLQECPTYGKDPIWIRPLEMFLETVIIDGKTQPRFSLLENC